MKKIICFRSCRLLQVAVLVCCALSASYAGTAGAQIKQPGAHPKYDFEAEPHLVLGNGFDHYYNNGVGLGFRGTVIIAHQAFIPSINNSVGIGFGGDLMLFGDDHCHNGGNNRYCHGSPVILPVVMQWNFWLHKRWSVFAEPGLALIFRDNRRDVDGDGDLDSNIDVDLDPFILFVGGRFHINPNTTLTLRLGYPTSATFGVSFLL